MRKPYQYLLALLLTALLVIPSTVSAAPGVTTESELRSAIQNNEAILLASDIELTESIDLNGYTNKISGADHTLSAGAGVVNLFTSTAGATPTFESITLDGKGKARAFKFSEANLTLKMVNFKNCTSENDHKNAEGGAVRLVDSTVNATNTDFENNQASNPAPINGDTKPHGGALYMTGGSATFDVVNFIGNTTKTVGDVNDAKNMGHGGAIYIDHGTNLTLNDSVFRKNHLGQQNIVTGGNIYAGPDAVLTLEHANFDIYAPFNTGGAVRLLHAKAKMHNVTFMVMPEVGDGGGVSGGAIACENSDLDILEASFGYPEPDTNPSKMRYAGGFITMVGKNNLKIDGGKFEGRGTANGRGTATYGGAICFESADSTPPGDPFSSGPAVLKNCSFSNFHADNYGGAIALSTQPYEENGVDLTLDNCTFSKCFTLGWGAKKGGTIGVGKGGKLTLNGGDIFWGESARGGAIYNVGETLIDKGAVIRNCWARSVGGAIFNDGVLTVRSADFHDCNTSERGKNPWIESEFAGVNIYANKDVTIGSAAKFDEGDVRVLEGRSKIILEDTLVNKINVSISEADKTALTAADEKVMLENAHRHVGYLVATGNGTYKPVTSDAQHLHYVSKGDQPFCEYADHESVGKWDAVLDPTVPQVVLGQRIEVIYHANPNGTDDVDKAFFTDETHAKVPTYRNARAIYKPVQDFTQLEGEKKPTREGFDFKNWYKRAVTDEEVKNNPDADVFDKLSDKTGEITEIIDPNHFDIYAGWTNKPEAVEPEPKPASVYGDILVSREKANAYESERDAVFKVKPGEVIDFQGTLDAKIVKDQLHEVTAGIPAPALAAVTMADAEVNFEFTLRIKPAPGLIIPDVNTMADHYRLVAPNFEIKSLQMDAEDIVIKMGLTDDFLKGTLKDLYDMIDNGGVDVLRIYIDGVRVPDTAKTGDRFTTSSEMSGTYRMVHPISRNPIAFDWTATQDHEIPDTNLDGTDFILADKTDAEKEKIQITLEVEKVEDPTPPPTPETKPIYGDILVTHQNPKNFDTEHDAVYTVEAGELIDYQGTLDAKTVKDQLHEVTAGIPTPALAAVTMADAEVNFEFSLRIKPAPGLIIPDVNTMADHYRLVAPNFEIKSLQMDAGDIVIKMGLTDDFLKGTLKDLYDMIDGGGVDVLRIYIDGVQVPDSAKAGDRFTTSSEMSGTYRMVHPLSRTPITFDWTATQDHEIPDTNLDGTDFILADKTDAEKEKIQLTLEVKAKEEPTPTPPVTPVDPDPVKPTDPKPTKPTYFKPIDKKPKHRDSIPVTGESKLPEVMGVSALALALLLQQLRRRKLQRGEN